MVLWCFLKPDTGMCLSWGLFEGALLQAKFRHCLCPAWDHLVRASGLWLVAACAELVGASERLGCTSRPAATSVRLEAT